MFAANDFDRLGIQDTEQGDAEIELTVRTSDVAKVQAILALLRTN